ncbi:UDP-N-acetylglucosamine--N-acetylmuramyl-(pentapeptide) pyrophosphoryl-undecaprenol N-acetylglucosamine transferase [Patescibacteria group bacterium]|nr:UDP-N-acetylglucosamine--N-acetylmuramyl-(pentapeptide) pyrophosphoryl-undecaprenol N-acetylglucosamine transferase [Patescibacteria group bacterium]
MKIVLTGGGTGGHFYPMLAVAEAIRDLVAERKLLEPELYFFGPNVLDERALFDLDISFVNTPAGKVRRYASILNVTDALQTGVGIVSTLIRLYQLYPDVVFSKGGYGAGPTLIAARILGIPVVIHDSDAVPGRATLFAAPFARRIALSFDGAAEQLPVPLRGKVAVTGNPIRRELRTPAREGAKEFLELTDHVPTLLILGGSQGAQALNNAILEALPELVQHYNVVHQTGEGNHASVLQTAQVVLDKNERRYRYKAFPFLSPLALKMAAGAADLVISRAGSGSIFEIASWKAASILVPLPGSAQDHQRANAYAYARAGACTVLEQANLTPHILVAEIERLFTNPKARSDMGEAASRFARPDASRAIAEAVLDVALEHAA